MKRSRVDIASIRREQIVEAALALIAEQGLENLSLSEIEKRAEMSRGQLTYYFPAKEDILLAVFDRVVQLMHQNVGDLDAEQFHQLDVWAKIAWLLRTVPENGCDDLNFHSLQYTFLAQMAHRPDFRERLARLYEDWRSRMSGDIAADFTRRPPLRAVDPRALATLIQAMLHGLAQQRDVDDDSFQTDQLVHLCLDMVGIYLWGEPANGQPPPNGSKRTRPARKPAAPLREKP